MELAGPPRNRVDRDVHARSVLATSMDSEDGRAEMCRLTGEVVGFCASLPGPTRAAHEAGPIG